MARCRVPLLFASLLLLVCAAAGAPDAATATECSALGFNSELVLCSDCDVLEDTVREAGLEGECRRCCVAGDGGDQTAGLLFTKATLEVDRWRLDPYPELKGFVNRKAKAYGNFAVVYTHSYRASPTLVLKRSAEEAAADGKPAEVRVTVGAWKTDQLDAFLKEKLAAHTATAK
jgi:hypothetical protein